MGPGMVEESSFRGWKHGELRYWRKKGGPSGQSALFIRPTHHSSRTPQISPPDGSTSPPVTPSAPLRGCPVCTFDASRRATSIRPQTNPPSRRVPSKLPPTRLRHRSTTPSPTDPAELATPNSALRGCRARPTRSYALLKPIATPRQPRTTRVRAVRPAVSVTVSARQTHRARRTTQRSRT